MPGSFEFDLRSILQYPPPFAASLFVFNLKTRK